MMLPHLSPGIRGAFALALAATAGLAAAQTPSEKLTDQIGIDQILGAPVPKDVPFLNERGEAVRFGDLLGERPVVLVPIFYRCQTGCNLISANLLKTLAKATRVPRVQLGKDHQMLVGREFDVVMLSIDPLETPELAWTKRMQVLDLYNQPQTAAGWHFLTGEYENIRQITDAIGFRYTYDPKTRRINHPAGIMILTPEGQVSSYILGVQYPTAILYDATARAAQNEVGARAETFLFGCIMLDPLTGERTLVYRNIVRLGGVLTMLVLFGSILTMSLRHRREPLPKGGRK
jgi:protein SCO1